MGEVLLIGSGLETGLEAGVTARAKGDIRVPWGKLREGLAEVGRELGPTLFSAWGDRDGPNSVSIELGVTATGEVGIIVSKVSVSVGTSITLTFDRPRH
jgi:hypothetical protein